MRSGGSNETTSVNPIEVFLALGANIGNRRDAIERGLEALNRLAVRVMKRSSFYETEPVGREDQPWFLNAVVQGETRLRPRELLAECKRVEALLGRVPTPRFGPRTLDVDILLYGAEQIDEPDLIIPHPRMDERRFVLIPLAEIAPKARDPRDGRRFADMLNGLDGGKKVLRLTARES